MTGYRNHSTSPEPVAVRGDLPILLGDSERLLGAAFFGYIARDTLHAA